MEKINDNFNVFSTMPFIPYRIIEYLAKSEQAENIFKILKYPSTDCLEKPNLSFKEKMQMIWSGDDPNQEKYNIFLTKKLENLQSDSTTIIKIYKNDIEPRNDYSAIASYSIDLIIRGKIDNIYNQGIITSRLDSLEQLILLNLNGIDVGGIGSLRFSRTLNRLCKSSLSISDNTNIIGTRLIMGVELMSLNKGIECNG